MAEKSERKKGKRTRRTPGNAQLSVESQQETASSPDKQTRNKTAATNINSASTTGNTTENTAVLQPSPHLCGAKS